MALRHVRIKDVIGSQGNDLKLLGKSNFKISHLEATKTTEKYLLTAAEWLIALVWIHVSIY